MNFLFYFWIFCDTMEKNSTGCSRKWEAYMKEFQFCSPTQVIFGKETEEQVGSLAKKAGAKKVLVHYGSSSAKDSGLLDRICRSLERSGLPYVTLGGVQPNPRLSKVYEGIALGRREKADFLLAVGGGSVIDSAKAIAYGLANDFDVWELYAKRREAKACLPIGAVLTIAAAGSETSNSSVITNDDGMLKRGYSSELCRCRFAIMNPELTYTLPPYQTASGCVDILMHMMERYFHDDSFDVALPDRMGEAVMSVVMEMAPRLMADPMDYEARAQVMWAGSLAHNDLLHCGNGTRGDWACHQLEHELGGRYDVAHGAGLAAVWPSWARFVSARHPRRMAAWGRRCLGIVLSGDDQKDALAAIAAFENFLRSIQMPTTLSELGLTLSDQEIEALAWSCSFQDSRTIGALEKLRRKDMETIYKMAR